MCVPAVRLQQVLLNSYVLRDNHLLSLENKYGVGTVLLSLGCVVAKVFKGFALYFVCETSLSCGERKENVLTCEESPRGVRVPSKLP